MKFPKINILMLGAVTALAFSSCENEIESESVITQFAQYEVVPEVGKTNITVNEVNEDIITFKIALDAQKQLNDITLLIEPGSNSTAVEGVDFELAEHEIEIPAFAGQDSVEIEIHILQDFKAGEEDETIYLTFSTVDPSGVTQSEELLVATIVDSDVVPELSPSIAITAAWNVDSDFFTGCDVADIDVYITDPGINVDFAASAGATGACPEAFELDLSGESSATFLIVADLYDVIDVGELGPLEIPLTVTVERGMTAGDVVNMVEIGQTVDIFTTENADGGFATYAIVGEIYWDADAGTYTIVDDTGTEAGSLRVNKEKIAQQIKALRAKAGK